MSSDAPAIPLFGDAYLADTRHLTLEEHGAYLQLLMVAWRQEDCSLPDDDSRLSRILGVTLGRWAKLKPTVMQFWQLADGRWTQKRLSKERAFVKGKSEKNSIAAKKRWDGQVSENKQQASCERITERNAPPPPPTEVSKKEEEAAPPARARLPDVPIDAAIDQWNEAAGVVGWPTVQRITDSRKASLRARIRSEGAEGWKAAIIRARASPYLGKSPPTFFTFDWFVKPSNFLKVIEGNYDRNHKSANDRQNELLNPMVRAAAAREARYAG